jgi:hypothetical protein
MDDVRTPWPEIVILSLLVAVAMFLMWRGGSEACHQWRDRVNVSISAMLASNVERDTGAEEDPPLSSKELQAKSKAILDDRPFACL